MFVFWLWKRFPGTSTPLAWYICLALSKILFRLCLANTCFPEVSQTGVENYWATSFPLAYWRPHGKFYIHDSNQKLPGKINGKMTKWKSYLAGSVYHRISMARTLKWQELSQPHRMCLCANFSLVSASDLCYSLTPDKNRNTGKNLYLETHCVRLLASVTCSCK